MRTPILQSKVKAKADENINGKIKRKDTKNSAIVFLKFIYLLIEYCDYNVIVQGIVKFYE